MSHTEQMRGMARVIADVMAERTRQVYDEGFDLDHDDVHDRGELARAAACYAHHLPAHAGGNVAPPGWPWSVTWWKPSGDRRRDLVKACALLVAELERIDRAYLELEIASPEHREAAP